MAGPATPDDIAAPGPVGRLLERAAQAVAMIGGLVMLGLMIVSSISVLGRSLPQLFGLFISGLTPKNIPGDIEIVQLGCAIAIFSFLPYCQIRRGNVFVDFFTKGLPVRGRAFFDFLANLLFLVLVGVIAWQLGHGTVEKFRNGDSTMVLRLPESWPYVIATACCWLLVAVTLYTVWRAFEEMRTGRLIGPYPSQSH